MITAPVGFVGLGRMGGPMAANVRAAGHDLVAFDLAGTEERAPEGARAAISPVGVAAASATVLLCLPDGAAVLSVVREIAQAKGRVTTTVVDHSTIGLAAANEVAAVLTDAGIDYLDAPVSGGIAGARAGSLAMMVAGRAATVARLRPVLETMAQNCVHVGDEVGQGQAMKLLNNFLSATAMAATSEAIAFGVDHGLDMAKMLDVLNVSTGRNTATGDKFPKRILTGTFDAGFSTQLMMKDVGLYDECVRASGARAPIGSAVHSLLEELCAALPDSDFTCIYPYIEKVRKSG